MSVCPNVRENLEEEQIASFENYYKKTMPCAQLFAFDNTTNKPGQSEFPNSDKHAEMLKAGARIYVHTTYKTTMTYHGSEVLAFNQYKYACSMGYQGIIIHMPVIELLGDEYGNKPTQFLGGGKRPKKSVEERYRLFLTLCDKLFHLIHLYHEDGNKAKTNIYFENMPCYYHSEPSNLFTEISLLKSRAAEISSHVTVGLCVDTAHVYVSGHDLGTKEQAKSYFDHLESIEPMIIHLNDSKFPKGSKRDVHAPWGERIWQKDRSGLEYIIELGYDCIVELNWSKFDVSQLH